MTDSIENKQLAYEMELQLRIDNLIDTCEFLNHQFNVAIKNKINIQNDQLQALKIRLQTALKDYHQITNAGPEVEISVQEVQRLKDSIDNDRQNAEDSIGLNGQEIAHIETGSALQAQIIQ